MQIPEHGTIARRKGRHGCPCTECLQAWRDYQDRVRRLRAYGRWAPFVDAEPSRAHVKSLQAAGIGPHRIAELSGLGYATISDLIWMRKTKVRPATEAAILAVRVDLDAYAPGGTVDGTGTRRRIQALAVVGWSIPVQAELLGLSRQSVQRITSGYGVYASTARAVSELYEKLWDQAPPEVSTGEKISANRSRTEAARRGWAAPMDWDNIDDPSEVPALVPTDPQDVDEIAVELALAGERVTLNRAEIAEVIRIGTERRMSANQLAEVTGRDKRTIQRRRSA